MKLNISEIFCSIQGESLFSGCPCVFIRLCGCNLRCTYCDTRYAYSGGTLMLLSEIVDHISRYRYRRVEITGGEPLFQNETPELIDMLLKQGYQLLLETNGSYDIRTIDQRCIRIVDIKCPGSGEAARNNLENLRFLTAHDQLKFVIGDRNDYEFTRQIITNQYIPIPGHQILLSTVADALDPAQLAKWILTDGLDVRLQLQLHKIIWPGIEKGI